MSRRTTDHRMHRSARPQIADRPGSGFTLIELLIVVAIIAILAALAVPNFLEAQLRTKVARAKTDMRTIGVALESYRVDYQAYVDALTPLTVLTTPVAYLKALPQDIFYIPGRVELPPFPGAEYYSSLYGYGAMPIDDPTRFVLSSLGPDTDLDTYLDSAPDSFALRFYPGYSQDLFSPAGVMVNASLFNYVLYDPTNGSMSSGDVYVLSDSNKP